MKIAVPVTANHYVDDHFGHCEFYNVFTVSENKVMDMSTIPSTQGCGCKSNIAGVLSGMGVEIMLAGGIGAGAINVLNSHGINVVRGCSGPAYEVVMLYLEGKVKDDGLVCSHHDHHNGNGSHQCSH